MNVPNIRFGQIRTFTGSEKAVSKRMEEVKTQLGATVNGQVTQNGASRGAVLTGQDMINFLTDKLEISLDTDIQQIITGELDPAEAQFDLIQRMYKSFTKIEADLSSDPIGFAKQALEFVDAQNGTDAEKNPFIHEDLS